MLLLLLMMMMMMMMMLTLLLTICRTLSGSCLVGAWLNASAGDQEVAAAATADSAKNLTEEVRNESCS